MSDDTARYRAYGRKQLLLASHARETGHTADGRDLRGDKNVKVYVRARMAEARWAYTAAARIAVIQGKWVDRAERLRPRSAATVIERLLHRFAGTAA